MLKVFVIEDERPAMDHLVKSLKQVDETINIVSTAGSVKESIEWLNNHPAPDLIFMDIQLNDGLSFNIFRHCRITSPVIFVTAYDQYTMDAFSNNGIDYLLKPLDERKLEQSINKYKNLSRHFLHDYASLVDYLNNQQVSFNKKTRIIVKRGNEYQTIMLDDVVYFYTENKIVFLISKDNKKFMVNKNLGELEEELDKHRFFRVNRQCIVNVDYIKKFKPIDRSKLTIELTLPTQEEIIISQENAGIFKEWISKV